MAPRLVALFVALLVGAGSTRAVAQAEPSPPRSETTFELTFNRPLFAIGTVLFAGAYVPSLLYTLKSDYNARSDLELPVVGPWLDFANRVCTVDPCDASHLNGGLLLVDGIVQSVGLLVLLASMVVPESVTHDWFFADGQLAVVPASMGRESVGASALGRF
jgi:hypothetical protein